MYRYSDELRDVLTRIRSPHCHTCDNGDIVEVRRNVSFMPPRPNPPRIIEKTIIDHQDCCCDPKPGPHCCDHRPSPLHGCDCHRHIDRCCCGVDCRGKDLVQFQPRTVVKRTTTVSADSTYSVLERWFKRYKNEDGYLGKAGLAELIENLGRSSDKKGVRRALKDADADGDNQLSFREYLRMWHKAASHGDDFLEATGCQDIVDIVNEYDLYPNVSCTDCYHHTTGKNDDQDTEDQGKCRCGSKNVIPPFVQTSNEIKRMNSQTNESGLTPIFKPELPIFSCNRLPACRPKNWRD
ncbi:hypothetical protein JTE90_007746 [Oedothorax gibbosus]|uniref:EF-hand domain-containing protein n=1 Tax=Oedothorax gibbosus TaxID=931172 RepID=A0AAV6V8M6_9ARAC|nr:hypothetical protein JTE90_007746 [Oedothorax gibbosus]